MTPWASNALKDGLTAARVLETGPRASEKARERFWSEYNPETATEEVLTRTLAGLEAIEDFVLQARAQASEGVMDAIADPVREFLAQRARKGREARILMPSGLLTKQAL